MRGMQASTPTKGDGGAGRLDGLRQHPVVGQPVSFTLDHREQVLYLVVGGWNTLVGYAVWATLQFLLGEKINYLVIVVIAWPIAVLNAYLCYRYIVFRSRGPILRELPRFASVYVSTLVATLLVLPIALHLLPFSIYVINGLFTAAVVVVSYLGHKHFSFRGGQRRPG
jgi:putative flippase GtrA